MTFLRRLVNAHSHILVLFLGTLVMVLVDPFLGIAYLLISALGTLWFMWRICTHCYAYGNRGCRSGYGIVASRLFSRASKRNFRRAFKVNIISVGVQWFIPLTSVYWLVTDFDPLLLIALIAFILAAFVYLPVSAGKGGCRSCPQRRDCPWTR